MTKRKPLPTDAFASAHSRAVSSADTGYGTDAVTKPESDLSPVRTTLL
jgi:hypothetical protein